MQVTGHHLVQLKYGHPFFQQFAIAARRFSKFMSRTKVAASSSVLDLVLLQTLNQAFLLSLVPFF